MTIFTDKAKVYVPRLMTDLQITKEQACGIFGNLGGETGGFSALQEKAPTVKGSRGGYGWMQWTGPRRKKYELWCSTNSLNPAADETNYKYLVQETLTDEVHSLVMLRKTTTVETATETFMKQNLRPGVPNLSGRINYAKQAMLAVQDQKKQDVQTGTAGGLVAVGVGTAAVTPHHVWPYIFVGTAIAVVLGLIAVHIYHEKEKEKVITNG